MNTSPEERGLIRRSSGDFFKRRLQAWGLAGVIGFFFLWQVLDSTLASTVTNVDRLAGPVEVAVELVDYTRNELVTDLWASLKVFFGGWGVGGALAILAGLLMGRVRPIGRALLPIVEAIRPVSSIVWLPLSIVWFGFGYTSKAFVVGLAVFLVVVVYTLDGSARVPVDVSRTAIMLGMGRFRRFRFVILPATLGETVTGLRVALMAGWGTVIIAELVAANSGLGYRLIRAQQSFDIAAVMATMAAFGVSGFLLDSLFSIVEKRLIPWRSTVSP